MDNIISNITLNNQDPNSEAEIEINNGNGENSAIESVEEKPQSLQDFKEELNVNTGNDTESIEDKTIKTPENDVLECVDDEEEIIDKYEVESKKDQALAILNEIEALVGNAEVAEDDIQSMVMLVNEESTTPMETEQITEVKLKVFFQNKTLIELSRCSWDRPSRHNYLRSCLWSPDGTCALTAVNNDGMRVFELPADLYNREEISDDRPVDILTPAVSVKEGGTVYDMIWYPPMNSLNPESCCWLATRQHEPIHMWDAFNGTLRCSYRGYDNVDEVEAALSLAFSPNGETIYAGYKKSLKIFQTDTPGRDYQNIPTKSTSSCISVNSVDTNLVALGSWNRSILILDTNSNDVLAVGDHRPENSHKAGVTHLKFSPSGEMLMSGARKDPNIFFWDLRNLSQPVFCVKRNVSTNQRIHFDLNFNGEWLVSGDTKGILHAWNLYNIDENLVFPELKFPIHTDCCNGVSFHPVWPILATSSGQFHFDVDEDDDGLGDKVKSENQLIFWWVGKGEFKKNVVEAS